MNCFPPYKVIKLFPHQDNCCICNSLVTGGDKGIPMYEGVAVPAEYEGDLWAGFCACENCYAEYTNGELEMWSIEQLKNMEAGD